MSLPGGRFPGIFHIIMAVPVQLNEFLLFNTEKSHGPIRGPQPEFPGNLRNDHCRPEQGESFPELYLDRGIDIVEIPGAADPD